MGRALNYRRAPRRSTYARIHVRPGVSSFRAIPPAQILYVRLKLARLKREAEQRRSRP